MKTATTLAALALAFAGTAPARAQMGGQPQGQAKDTLRG
jgi:hypothetical protein